VYCTANDVPVIAAKVIRPRLGAWTADLTVDAKDASKFAGAVTIVLGGLTFVGTAHRSGTYKDTVFVRVVGGGGGMDAVVEPRSYRNVPVKIPLSNLLAAAGERLSTSCEPASLGVNLPFWSWPSQTARRALFSLMTAASAPAWRILPDGSVWIGHETWGATPDFAWDLLVSEPSLGRITIGADSPKVAPGQVWSTGQRVSAVEHSVAADRIRHTLLFESATDTGDRLKAAVTSVVRDLSPRVDYLAGYWTRVVAQAGDGSLDLKPDDTRLTGYQHVPIRYGIPGIAAKVSPGARCLLEFAGGDPTKPFVATWETGTAIQLDIHGTTTNVAGTTISVSGTTITLDGTLVKVGSPAVDAAIKGTTYSLAEGVFLTALKSYVADIQAIADPAPPHAATVALQAACTVFAAASSTYLSTKAKIG